MLPAPGCMRKKQMHIRPRMLWTQTKAPGIVGPKKTVRLTHARAKAHPGAIRQCRAQGVPAICAMHSSVTALQPDRSSFRSWDRCAKTLSAGGFSPVQQLRSRLCSLGSRARPLRSVTPAHWLRLRLCSCLKAASRTMSPSCVLYMLAESLQVVTFHSQRHSTCQTSQASEPPALRGRGLSSLAYECAGSVLI